MNEMRSLLERQDRAAREVLAVIDESASDLNEVELGYPVDDHEARVTGWSCVGAWRGDDKRRLASLRRPDERAQFSLARKGD